MKAFQVQTPYNWASLQIVLAFMIPPWRRRLRGNPSDHHSKLCQLFSFSFSLENHQAWFLPLVVPIPRPSHLVSSWSSSMPRFPALFLESEANPVFPGHVPRSFFCSAPKNLIRCSTGYQQRRFQGKIPHQRKQKQWVCLLRWYRDNRHSWLITIWSYHPDRTGVLSVWQAIARHTLFSLSNLTQKENGLCRASR